MSSCNGYSIPLTANLTLYIIITSSTLSADNYICYRSNGAIAAWGCAMPSSIGGYGNLMGGFISSTTGQSSALSATTGVGYPVWYMDNATAQAGARLCALYFTA